MATVLRSVRARLLNVEDVLPGGAVFGGLEGFWIDATLVAELGRGAHPDSADEAVDPRAARRAPTRRGSAS
jgi:hypothetical protein